MLAACNRGGVAVAEGLEADAAGVVAGVLHAALHESCRRRREHLHIHCLLVHPSNGPPPPPAQSLCMTTYLSVGLAATCGDCLCHSRTSNAYSRMLIAYFSKIISGRFLVFAIKVCSAEDLFVLPRSKNQRHTHKEQRSAFSPASRSMAAHSLASAPGRHEQRSSSLKIYR